MRLLSRARRAAVSLLSLAAVMPALACGLAGDRRVGDGGFDDASSRAALGEGRIEEALDLAGAAIERAAPLAAPHELASKVESLAMVFYETGDAPAVEAAEALLHRALTLREEDPDRGQAAAASLLHDLSGLAFNRGDFASAEALERRAIALREEALPADDPLLAISRRDLGYIFLNQGRLAEGEPLLVAAHDALTREGAAIDPAEAAATNLYLADLRRLQGRHEEAARLLNDLIHASAGTLGEDDPQVQYMINNLAGVYRDMERFDEAEALLHRSLALRRRAQPPDAGAIARATLNLAELYRLQGKLADAEPLYRDALADARRTYGAGSSELIEFVNQLGVVLRESGRTGEAEPMVREALALSIGSLGRDHPRVAQSASDLADLLRAAGRCNEARSHYDRAAAIRRQVFGPEHPEVAAVLVSAAACAAKEPAEEATRRADLDRAIAILAASPAYPGAAADALALRAQARRAKEPAAAKQDLEAALDRIEALRPRRGGGETVRAEFLGARRTLYETLALWEVEDGRAEAAFAVSERARARALMDQLATSRVGESMPATGEAAAALDRARSEIAECRERIAFAQMQPDADAAAQARTMAALAGRMEKAYGAFRLAWDRARNESPVWRAAAPASDVTLERIRNVAVPRDGLLLSYLVGEASSLLFVVSPSGAMEAIPLRIDDAPARRLGISAGPLTRGSLDRIVFGEAGRPGVLASLASPPAASSRRGIGGTTAGDRALDSRLVALYRALIPDAARGITGAAEVVIVPDGPLVSLPFEALVMTEAGTGSTRFWIDDGPPIRYAPSAGFLVATTPSASGAAGSAAPERLSVLSVSNPEYGTLAGVPAEDPSRLPPLPGTALETAAIRSAFAGIAQVTVLDGERAREPAVRRAMAGRRWIHLATHGLADERGGGLFAALALAPPAGARTPEDDGLLELHEIYSLALQADLAILSACGSNVGRRVAGEGAFALSRGFLAAGARGVIASQWPVDDDATAALIGALFASLARAEREGREPRVSVALRDAQRQVRQRTEWEHPFFWAPFILSGAR